MRVLGVVVGGEQVGLVELEGISDLLGPCLDQGVLGDVLGAEDAVLVLEAVVEVLLEDALGLVGEALVQEHGHQLVGDPDAVVVGQGQERVGELHLLSHCGVQEFHIQECLEYRVHDHGVVAHQVVDDLDFDSGFPASEVVDRLAARDGRVVTEVSGGETCSES